MPSALDFGTRALIAIGVIDPTETPSSEDAATTLQVLNDWVDSLATQRLSIHFLTRTAKTLANGTASYTIGASGNIDVARPLWLDQGSARLVTDTGAATPTEVPLRVFTDDEWKAIAQKSLQSSMPIGIWYDHGWTTGLARIYVWPIPNVGTTQLILYTPTAIAEFADQSTVYTFPPGYRRMIWANLAVELLAEYPEAKVSDEVRRMAANGLALIKRANIRLSEVSIDPALTRGGGGMTASKFASGDF